MSIFFKKSKGWRYDFTLKGVRHTKAWFETKKEAIQAMVLRKEEIVKPKIIQKTPTDMDFLTLVNKRLDHIKVYNSDKHYIDSNYYARRWIKRWGQMLCNEISFEMIEKYIIERSKVSNYTANMEIKNLKATFNFGKKRKYVNVNPCENMQFLPYEKPVKKYIPTPDDIDKVIALADDEMKSYLWVIRETMGQLVK